MTSFIGNIQFSRTETRRESPRLGLVLGISKVSISVSKLLYSWYQSRGRYETLRLSKKNYQRQCNELNLHFNWTKHSQFLIVIKGYILSHSLLGSFTKHLDWWTIFRQVKQITKNCSFKNKDERLSEVFPWVKVVQNCFLLQIYCCKTCMNKAWLDNHWINDCFLLTFGSTSCLIEMR